MSTSARRSGRRRFTLIAQLVAVVLAVAAAVTVIAEGPGGHPAAERLAADEMDVPALSATPLPPSVVPAPSASAPVSSSPAQSPSPVLRMPGAVPSAGAGRFSYDDRGGPVLGRAGEVRRYRVAVEVGSGEDAAAFGEAVRVALAGPGSWVDSGRLRLQQVPAGASRDFTVYLATAGTARRMCADGGVDIRVGGRAYTSCRAPGQVIINLDRWRLSVPHFVRARVPLQTYRTYVVNHEVGHQLGHRHERCPGSGRPAPVMMQQTLFLNGCTPNPWPYVGGRRYAGPPL
ncbi:DUF3152 domain-containing protein [Micromonospora sp. GCM10011542]|uniref:DUF3152 domain-containing protein n=1 Tax=Micromonospora sp. GCM10011542 TaxID=3317337 RepID=UPI00360B239D